MEKQKERISRFSKVIYILLKISYITFIVVGAICVLVWLLSLANLNTEILMIGGVEREIPVLFKLGDFNIYLPILWESGFDFSGFHDFMPSGILGFHRAVGFGDLLYVILIIVGISFAMNVFKLLRDNGSPFRDDIVRALKKLAIALLCLGIVSGIIPFLAAGIVWVLCLIFDYGRTLQNESDTTL